MIWHEKSVLVSLIALGLCGCSTPKGVQQRGWVGGEYASVRPALSWPVEPGHVIYAFPENLKSRFEGGLLITDLPPETPLARAGLQEGDILLEISGKKLSRLKRFREVVDAAGPGQILSIALYRAG